jgi:hypothetical protein
MKNSKAKIDEFKAAIGSIDRWTMKGCYNFLKESSSLKKLMQIARYDSFNSATIVTVGDNGTFRTFEVNEDRVERTSRMPEFCRQWKLQTGGRSNIAYRKGGYAPEGGLKRNQEADNNGPVAKKRWGTRDNSNRGHQNRRGGHRR